MVWFWLVAFVLWGFFVWGFFLVGGIAGLGDGNIYFLIFKKEKEDLKIIPFLQSWLKRFLHVGTDSSLYYKCVRYAINTG